jgi:glycosyltransferase involved in cell wall biosynthesis
MPLRVLHVVPALAERYGGPSAATVGMCRALREAGVDVVIATTDADGGSRLDVPIETLTRWQGVPTVFFARARSEAFKWSPALARWLRRHVGEFDVVHAHAVFSHSTVAAGRACRAAGVPYLVRPLGTLDPWSLGRHAYRKRLLLALGLRAVLARAAALHYTTAEEHRLAERALPTLPRGVVVPLGLDAMWFDAPRVERRNQLVVMSRLDPKKGIDVAIRAFQASAVAREGGWRLVIAGAGEAAYEGHLRRLAGDAAVRDRVTFTGWLQGEHRVELLSRSRLFLLPSHQENFGIAVVEAMACGTPVLVSPGVNLADEILAAGAGWVAGNALAPFSAAVDAALADPAELERRGGRARELAQAYRWPAVSAALETVYADVVSAHGRRADVTAAARPARWSTKA